VQLVAAEWREAVQVPPVILRKAALPGHDLHIEHAACAEARIVGSRSTTFGLDEIPGLGPGTTTRHGVISSFARTVATLDG
jgi:hypothetical protein